jgi:gliding motility-associated lipoprotein GldB
MYKYCALILCCMLLVSCTKKEKLSVDVSDIEATVTIKRFDQAFYTSSAVKLAALKNDYPYLFPTQTPDSIWVAKMQDQDEQALFAETQKVYQTFEDESAQLSTLFKHIKYYYSTFKEPTVITVLSNVAYESSVVYADSLLFISLDVFLGDDSVIYQDFPDYIKRNFTKDHLSVAVAEALAEREIPRPATRTFISRIIQRGKLLYMMDAFLPKVNDAYKIGYTTAQIEWAHLNDIDIWKYFIENEYLFSTDQELSSRFIENAPFSKFFLANDNESPGRIGEWFGWQIVRAFMEHNEVSLQQMLQTDNETIFKKSKYKPSK